MPTENEDKDAIREVLAEYCYALDNYKFTEMAALFTEDGTWNTAFGTAAGHAAIADLAASFTRNIAEPPRRVHYVTNIIIRLNGDMDTMVRQAGKWKFQYRKIDRFLK